MLPSSATQAGEEGHEHETDPAANFCSLERVLGTGRGSWKPGGPDDAGGRNRKRRDTAQLPPRLLGGVVLDNLVVASAGGPTGARREVGKLAPRQRGKTLLLAGDLLEGRELADGFGVKLVFDDVHGKSA